MNEQQFRHEDRRGGRFESAQITAADQTGLYGLGVLGPGWDGVGTAVDVDPLVGGHAIVLSSVDNDNPIIIGEDTWITS